MLRARLSPRRPLPGSDRIVVAALILLHMDATSRAALRRAVTTSCHYPGTARRAGKFASNLVPRELLRTCTASWPRGGKSQTCRCEFEIRIKLPLAHCLAPAASDPR